MGIPARPDLGTKTLIFYSVVDVQNVRSRFPARQRKTVLRTIARQIPRATNPVSVPDIHNPLRSRLYTTNAVETGNINLSGKEMPCQPGSRKPKTLTRRLQDLSVPDLRDSEIASPTEAKKRNTSSMCRQKVNLTAGFLDDGHRTSRLLVSILPWYSGEDAGSSEPLKENCNCFCLQCNSHNWRVYSDREDKKRGSVYST
jgi:hypothetical protein